MKRIGKCSVDQCQNLISKSITLHPLLFIWFEKQLQEMQTKGKFEPLDEMRFKWIQERYVC